MPRTQYASRGGIDALISIAQQCGLPIRTVAALASVNRLGILFDNSSVLRRFDDSPQTAQRLLRSRQRRWEQRDLAHAQTEARTLAYSQCPYCGNGHNGHSAGAGTTTCTRCGSDLTPNRHAPIDNWPTVPVYGEP
jgi:hypothetical protein